MRDKWLNTGHHGDELQPHIDLPREIDTDRVGKQPEYGFSITKFLCCQYVSQLIQCLKNVSRLTCNNLDIHDLITIIFGRSVTEKVRNQMMFCFSTSPI